MMSEDQTFAAADSIGLSTTQMKDVLEVSRLFASTTDLESLLLKIVNATCSLLLSERASIWLHDAATQELYTTVVLQTTPLRVPANSGIVGAAFTTNQPVTVHSAYDDPRFNPSSDRATGYRTRSLLAMPMLDIQGQPVGIIQAVNKIEGSFTSQDESLLQLLADQAGVAIQRHNLQGIARQAAQMQREIDLARTVQQALLPQTLPEFKTFDLFGWARAASTTGGDCYDLWHMGDGRLGILLADASGHGLAPALVVSQIRTLVRVLCDSASPLPKPHEVLSRINKQMCKDLVSGRFVTVFLGFLSPGGMLHWQSAGHGPIFVRCSADDAIQTLDAVVPPINVLIDLPDDSPEPIQLKPGGMLAVMSDGIFESFSPERKLFGTEHVAEILQTCSHQTASNIAANLLKAVTQWQQHDQPTDDQTLIVLNRLDA